MAIGPAVDPISLPFSKTCSSMAGCDRQAAESAVRRWRRRDARRRCRRRRRCGAAAAAWRAPAEAVAGPAGSGCRRRRRREAATRRVASRLAEATRCQGRPPRLLVGAGGRTSMTSDGRTQVRHDEERDGLRLRRQGRARSSVHDGEPLLAGARGTPMAPRRDVTSEDADSGLVRRPIRWGPSGAPAGEIASCGNASRDDTSCRRLHVRVVRKVAERGLRVLRGRERSRTDLHRALEPRSQFGGEHRRAGGAREFVEQRRNLVGIVRRVQPATQQQRERDETKLRDVGARGELNRDRGPRAPRGQARSASGAGSRSASIAEPDHVLDHDEASITRDDDPLRQRARRARCPRPHAEASASAGVTSRMSSSANAGPCAFGSSSDTRRPGCVARNQRQFGVGDSLDRLDGAERRVLDVAEGLNPGQQRRLRSRAIR